MTARIALLSTMVLAATGCGGLGTALAGECTGGTVAVAVIAVLSLVAVIVGIAFTPLTLGGTGIAGIAIAVALIVGGLLFLCQPTTLARVPAPARFSPGFPAS